MPKQLPQYINVKGKLMDLSHPRVMGILNLTPDSFYAASRKETETDIIDRCRQIVGEGADIIDIGACSSRPGSVQVDATEEMQRLRDGLKIICKHFPEAILSIDTYRADAAKMCVEEYGAAIINDISAGEMDSRMLDTIARLNVPYVLTHMKGTPPDMQEHPHYEHLLKEVFFHFSEKIQSLRSMGVKDLILDPGFGFGKTLEHNYCLMNHLEEFNVFQLPILTGVSRKSMIYKLLGCTPEEALNGTTVLHTAALLKGASILRVHDVEAAREAIRIITRMKAESAF